MLTRPQAQSERFAQICRATLGAELQIILSPLLKIEMLLFDVPLTPYRGLIFTSENGVQAFAQTTIGQGMPAYCVGARTTNAARDAGLEAISADGTADDLVEMINAAEVAGPLLHIRGEHTRGNIAGRINAQVDEVVAYRQLAQPLSDVARSALQSNEVVILPLFSPRTAQLFFEQADSISADLKVIAISAAVNDVILDTNKAKTAASSIADTPNALAMIQAIKCCYETI